MLRLFFHRESPVVRGLNLAGFILGTVNLPGGSWIHTLALLQYAFLNFCAYYPWYGTGQKDKYLGIRLHFWKTLVPVAYIAPIHAALTLWLSHWAISLTANILYGILTAGNLILLYLHCRDPHVEPPNLYSTGRYT